MAAALFNRAFPLLLVAALLLSTAAAAASSHDHHGEPATRGHLHHHHGHGHDHHRSPSTTRIESEENRQSLGIFDPVLTPVAARALPGEEATAAMGAAPADADPMLPHPPSPPPSFVGAEDLISLAPQAEDARRSASQPSAAPPAMDEPAAAATTTTTLPLPSPYREAASRPPPVHAAAEGMVSSGGDLDLQRLAKVLASLGYNEMASAATLLTDSPLVATWPGAITVFAAPDLFLQAACPGCSRRQLLLDHIALGSFQFAELAAARTTKILSASGFCLDVGTERGPEIRVSVDGVEISQHALYDDGRYVVHGLHGFVPPLSPHSCCVKGPHLHRQRHHHPSARSAAASVVRVLIREAISRLRERGFGFVALALRMQLGELEMLANLTVFALDDQAIFSGRGHGYISAVGFHIVPDHRLTRDDLLLLRAGSVLPTLAGEDRKLVITHGVGSNKVHINGMSVKKADIVTNSHLAIHGICGPFARVVLASVADAVASAIPTSSNCGGVQAIGECTSTTVIAGAVPAAKGSKGYDGDGESSAPEVATTPPADKPDATTTTLGHPYSTASAARPHHPEHGGRLHISEKVGRAGVGAHPVGGAGHGAAAAAAAAVVGAGIVGTAIGLLVKERRLKEHKKRLSKMARRHVGKLKKRRIDPDRCQSCQLNENAWLATCCNYHFCSLCVVNGYLDTHVHIYRRQGGNFCGRNGQLVPIVEPEFDVVNGEFFFTGEEKCDGHYMKVKTFVSLVQLQARQLPKRLMVWHKRSDGSRMGARLRSPVKKNTT